MLGKRKTRKKPLAGKPRRNRRKIRQTWNIACNPPEPLDLCFSEVQRGFFPGNSQGSSEPALRA